MWFWLCILALCSFVDYVTWTLRIIIPRDKLGFVKRHLDVESYVYGPSSKRKSSAAAMMASQKRVSTIESIKAFLIKATFELNLTIVSKQTRVHLMQDYITE